MSVTIIVEDGSIVADANSYAAVATAIAYAANRGVTLTADDATAIMLIKSMDYLGQFDERWIGEQVSPGVQALAWPRQFAYYQNGQLVDYLTIPINLVRAQCQLCIEQSNGIVLVPSVEPGLPVIREKIDVIETEYASPSDVGTDWYVPSMPLVDALLAPLLRPDSFRLRSVRI